MIPSGVTHGWARLVSLIQLCSKRTRRVCLFVLLCKYSRVDKCCQESGDTSLTVSCSTPVTGSTEERRADKVN